MGSLQSLKQPPGAWSAEPGCGPIPDQVKRRAAFSHCARLLGPFWHQLGCACTRHSDGNKQVNKLASRGFTSQANAPRCWDWKWIYCLSTEESDWNRMRCSVLDQNPTGSQPASKKVKRKNPLKRGTAETEREVFNTLTMGCCFSTALSINTVKTPAINGSFWKVWDRKVATLDTQNNN